MKKKKTFLIYGAGVIGSIFATKLALSGQDVTVLARGNRLNEINENGLILKNALNEKEDIAEVKVVSELKQDDFYDYIFVVVQNTQIDSIIPNLSNNISPNIVFVVNTASGYEKWIEGVGKKRMMIGFPSAGGERTDGKVHYFIGKGIKRAFQTTTFGDLSNSKSVRLRDLIKIFKRAGVPSVSCNNMDAWQKTHVAMVTSIANILYKYNGNNYELSKHYHDVKLMIKGIKEGFKVLRALGYKITPFKLNFFQFPLPLLSFFFKLMMGTKLIEITMAKHTVVAKNEMKSLQGEFDSLIQKSGVSTPSIDKLRTYLLTENN